MPNENKNKRSGSLQPLDVGSLCTLCDGSDFGFESTAELEDINIGVGQQRALDSIRFGVRIVGEGYNIFALGPAGVGKLSAIKEIIQSEAQSRPVPDDSCYVNNFDLPHKPCQLRLPAGRGSALSLDIDQLVEELIAAVPSVFQGENFQSRIAEIEQELQERQTNALNEVNENARAQKITFMHTPGGFAFAPSTEKGEVMDPDAFQKLSVAKQAKIQKTVEKLQSQLQKVLRQFPQWDKEARQKVRDLNQEFAGYSVSHLVENIMQTYADLPQVVAFLKTVKNQIIEHIDEFRGLGQESAPLNIDHFQKYRVNLIVDNSSLGCAPVIYEDLPTHLSLVGRAEHQSEMGTLVTNFTLIKSGALHKANGGYLILDARQILVQPFAWDSLKRALTAREVKIESLEQRLSLISTISLEPEAIPLDIKVIIFGDRMLYYMLSQYDPEFSDLFKVAADFDDSMDRSPQTQGLFARMMASVVRNAGLRALDKHAVARVINQSSREMADSEKLSTHLRSLGDLLRESNYWAGQADRDVIAAEDVQRAIDEQVRRSDRIRERVYEGIHRGTIYIDTQGEVIGQVNGLSVLQLGGFSFGQPSRITATTRLGVGKVIDIEREIELGGAIHSKGVMILSSYLGSHYARKQPLSINASLVFEQSYGMVDGDSASMAELCALLSHLAGVPIKQSLAITGSVNQHGQAQPIGGVNQKIEGFYDICKGKGLTGEQGVIIPSSNIKHLMLREDVVRACEQDEFSIYAIGNVEQALTLLTGTEAGERQKNGRFPKGSVNAKVEQALLEFSDIAKSIVKDPENSGKAKSGKSK